MSTQTLKGKPFKKLFNEHDLDLIKAPIKLFHPYRMLIMKTLMLHGTAEFRQLKYNIPEITDGNLASHLGVLEKLGYLRCHKEVVNRKLRTSHEITAKGRKIFEEFKTSLKKMIEDEAKV